MRDTERKREREGEGERGGGGGRDNKHCSCAGLLSGNINLTQPALCKTERQPAERNICYSCHDDDEEKKKIK